MVVRGTENSVILSSISGWYTNLLGTDMDMEFKYIANGESGVKCDV